MALKRFLVLIGLILFAFILSSIDLQKLILILLKANLYFIFPAFVLLFFVLFGKTLKWWLIVRGHGINFSLKDSFYYWCAGFFVSIFTPGRIGDVVRAFYLRKNTRLITGFSTVVIDRLIDVTLLLFLSFFALLFFAFIFGVEIISFPLIFLIFVIFIILIFLFSKKKYAVFFLKPFFKLLVPEKFREKLQLNFSLFYESLNEFKRNKSVLIKAIGVSLFTWFCSISIGYLAAVSLQISLPFYFFWLVIPIITLVELIPVTVSGFGTREATVIFLFSFYSLSSEQAVAFSLLYWIIAYLSVIFIGFLCFIKNPINFNIIKND